MIKKVNLGLIIMISVIIISCMIAIFDCTEVAYATNEDISPYTLEDKENYKGTYTILGSQIAQKDPGNRIVCH